MQAFGPHSPGEQDVGEADQTCRWCQAEELGFVRDRPRAMCQSITPAPAAPENSVGTSRVPRSTQ